MRAVAHSPAFAAKVNVPQRVGQDFEAADQAAARNCSKKRKGKRHGKR